MTKSKLSKLMAARGLRQRDLVRLTGIRQTAVSTSCKNGIRTARLAKIYAKALGCNPLDIIEL